MRDKVSSVHDCCMSAFIANLPDNIIQEIANSNYSVADLECLNGDTTSSFVEFNHWNITGINSSEEATSSARKKFPELNFETLDWTASQQLLTYDVIVSVNTLVNYTNPGYMITSKLSSAKKYIILLLPYEEKKDVFNPNGRVSFSWSNIPLSWSGWSCCYSQIIDIPQTVSTDKREKTVREILLVYVSDEHRKEKKINYVMTDICAVRQLISKELCTAQTQLHTLQEKFESLQTEYQNLTFRFSDMEYHFNRTINSFCWRITKPVRIIAPLFSPLKKIRNKVINFINAWRLFGLKHTFAVYSCKLRSKFSEPFDIMNLIKKEVSKKSYKGVYVIPSIIWDTPIFQRPQQMALAMADKNYLVIYLEPACSEKYPAGFVRSPYPNLHVVTTTDYSKSLANLSDCIVVLYSTTLLDITFLTQDYLKRNKVVYEYIDHFDESISGSGVTSLIESYHRILKMKEVILLASAKILQKELAFKSGKEVMYVANGVDIDHYSEKNVENILGKEDLPACLKSERIKIGYFGALAPWLDYDLLNRLMKNHPEWDFIYIGPDYYGGSKILDQTLDNCHYIGPINYPVLPGYASSFDVTILPFKKGDLAKSTSPLKLFEYFALGKPVVVTPDMEECIVFSGVFTGDGAQQFAQAIEKAIAVKDNKEFIEEQKKQAAANSWQARAEAFITGLEKVNRK